MDRSWRRVVLGVGGLGMAGAVLLASGFFAPRPEAAPVGQAALPPAVAPPQVSGQDASLAPAQGGAATAAAQTPEARIAALTKELQERPKHGPGWAELGLINIQLRKYPPAADAYGAALELEPGNVEYRTNYATALFFMGMPRMALQEYRKIVEQDPENAAAHMNLAVALSHSAPPNIPAAIEEWQAVIRLAPGQPVATKAQEYLAGYRKP